MDFLFHRKKPLKKQTLCFSIAIILSLLFLTSSDSSLNMENPKSSIFQDFIGTSTLYFLTLVQ